MKIPLVIATRNPNKAAEMIAIIRERLSEYFVIQTLDNYPAFDEPEETELSYAGNAKIKAEAACLATSQICVADDAGLEVDALEGNPGVHSKRFAGEATSFSEKIKRILTALENVPHDKRSARFRCAVAVALPSGNTEIFEAVREGYIASEPVGSNGFGYDSIFYIPELDATMAEIEPSVKNSVSHRAQVLKLACDWLIKLAEEQLVVV